MASDESATATWRDAITEAWEACRDAYGPVKGAFVFPVLALVCLWLAKGLNDLVDDSDSLVVAEDA